MIKNISASEKCGKCNDQAEFLIDLPFFPIPALISCDECEKGFKNSKEVD